jgi:hypothetical protein
MLYWNTGEHTLLGPGAVPTDPPEDLQLVPQVVKNISAGTLAGLAVLYHGGLGRAGYRSIKVLQAKGWTLADLARW